jgi:hypothetical protein
MIINHPSIHASIHPSIIPWTLGVRKKAPFPTNQSSQSNNIIYLISPSFLTFARKEKKRKEKKILLISFECNKSVGELARRVW